MNIDKFLALPEVPWDEETPLFSDITQRFYQELWEVEANLEEGQEINDLQLLATKPVFVRELDSSWCENDLEFDEEPPGEVLKAMDEFNKAVAGIIISYTPVQKRIKLD